MKNNVISIDRARKSQYDRPDDLMTIREFCNAFGFKYGYVYKYSVRAEKEGFDGVKVYHKGQKAISKKEFFIFEEKRGKK